jgi:hypothetical protein
MHLGTTYPFLSLIQQDELQLYVRPLEARVEADLDQIRWLTRSSLAARAKRSNHPSGPDESPSAPTFLVITLDCRRHPFDIAPQTPF